DFLLELEVSNSFQFQSSNLPIIYNTYCVIYVYIYISMFLEASNKNLLEFGSSIGIGSLEVQRCFQLPVSITAYPYPYIPIPILPYFYRIFTIFLLYFY